MEDLMALRKSLLAVLGSAMFIVALSVFGVSSAAASTTEECKVPAVGEIFTSRHFSDANCEKENTEGEFHTTAVNPNALLTRTNTGLVVAQTEVLGTPFEVSCEKYSGNTTVSNFEKEGVMGFKGEGKISISGCAVKKPAGCSIKPIETVTLTETSEDLKEVQRTLFQPKEGTKLATVTVTGCAIEGSYALNGKLRSQTVNIHTEEFNASSGSEATLGGKSILFTFPFHDATVANGKTIVRELP
jgi:hypothetical protein